MARLSRAESAARPIRVRLSPIEFHQMQTAARVNHQTLSGFMREAIASAAGDCLEQTPVLPVKSNRRT